MKNTFVHGLSVGVLFFIVTYGASLVHFIPDSVGNMTVYSILGAIIAAAKYQYGA